ncbi:MAG: tetratricopeptide repeat protein [Vicinamibacteria bacterium]
MTLRVAARVALAACVVLALPRASATALAEQAPPAVVLASYGFDDGVETGPDTFAVFRGGRGHVALSRAFQLSGYRSVELRDAAGDGDFPELQGYVPLRREGRLWFHFGFLTSDPAQELNVALAGPEFFQLKKDGIAFWLAVREGRLVHVSDSIPKRLFVPEAFVWYTVDLGYDVGRGRYDLTIRREGRDQPIVILQDQANAANQPGSAVDKFSLAGAPFTDASSVVYYVDDVGLAAEGAEPPAAFVAPGRRKLFVDAFVEHQRRLAERPRCLPAATPDDLGLDEDDVRALDREGATAVVAGLLRGERSEWRALLARTQGSWRANVEALGLWAEGCALLERGSATEAQSLIERAAELAPDTDLYRLSAAVALAGLGRFTEADQRLASVAAATRDDPRFGVISGFVGIARGDLDATLRAVRDPAARELDRGGQSLAIEQYFHAQLWKGEWAAARDYALLVAARLAPSGVGAALWHERAGDASLFLRELREAEESYQAARRSDDTRAVWLDLKLADVAFLRGDVEAERALRERYFGDLRQ